MNLIEYVTENLGEYKQHGEEINLKECPFCGKSKWKFYLNRKNGLYNCFHASCRAKGHINKLAAEKEITIDDDFEQGTNNQLKEVDFDFSTLGYLNRSGKEYLTGRGISSDTLEQMKYQVLQKNDWIIFLYSEKTMLVGFKARNIKEKRFFSAKGSKAVLFNFDYVDFDKPLLIVEGEIDCLSALESGIENVVSVPFGVSNLDWINNHFEDLKKFPEIILAFDNDEPGRKANTEVIRRLEDEECNTLISVLELKEYKDLNEALNDEKDLQEIIKLNKKEITIQDVIAFEDIDTEFKEYERYRTGIKGLDMYLGGIRMGEVSIFSGSAGSGKSTLANQLLVQGILSGYRGYIFSGELPNNQLSRWIIKQFCNEKDLYKKTDSYTEKTEYYPTKDAAERVKKTLGDRLLVDENSTIYYKELLKKMEFLIKRNGIKIFLIDNLMKVDCGEAIETSENEVKFVSGLKDLVNKYQVHIMLVAHPRKPDSTGKTGQYDIYGSSKIPNLVDNIIFVKRLVSEDDWKTIPETQKEELRALNVSTIITQHKSREGFELGGGVPLNFSGKTNRFYINKINEINIEAENDFEKSLDEIEKLLGV